VKTTWETANLSPKYLSSIYFLRFDSERYSLEVPERLHKGPCGLKRHMEKKSFKSIPQGNKK
jgi:hypothetical protein